MIADRRQDDFPVRALGVGLVLALGIANVWQPAAGAEFQCRHDDLLRRVEVATGEAARDAACEVRYWRDASSPPGGEVLWRANRDIDFCHAKARDLLARLETGGWTCAPNGSPGKPAPSQAAARSAPLEPPAAQSAPPTAATAEALAAVSQRSAREAETEPSGRFEQPPGVIAGRQGRSAAMEEQSATMAATVEPAAPAHQPMPRTVAGVAPSAPAEAAAEPPADPPSAMLLDRVVGQTLESVQQMYGGDFRAEDTAFGDLDGDGRDDAAVLITYQSENEDYVQYLVAYLFDGETFQSTATKNVGGRFLNALRADVREIVDRAIVVDLQALDAVEVCCETRRAAFVLREGELVEVEDPAGASRG
jgi:hypothetical protein